jgi:GT2 family glycosyltransferase
MRDLAILIVNWNVRDLLRACLTSIYAELETDTLDAEVWVVDNASYDGSVQMVQDEFPQARLIISAENRGFAAGNNLALRQMAGEDGPVPPRYAFLLNPDTELRPHALRTLVDFMQAHPRVGVAGAQLFYGDGTFQHGAFGFPGLWQILFDLYPLPGRLYESRLNGRYPRAWYQSGAPFPIDHPLGAAMMLRWQAIDQTGFFDEGFHMYCEEIDWCMRIKKSGWDIYCVPRAEVVHHVGQSTRQIQSDSFVNLWRSRRRLYDKHYGPLKHFVAKHLVRAGMRRKTRIALQAKKRGELDAEQATSRVQAYHGALACFE